MELNRHVLAWTGSLITLLVVCSQRADAVPSFSRQTGLGCTVCHNNPPELTAFGRLFKLNGYTMTDLKPDSTIGDHKDLKINKYIPFSAMFLLDDTFSQKKQPDTQNGSVEFPQAFSIFLAGMMAPHFGGMIQATYSHQSDHFGLDNTDLRYANHATLGRKDLLYGITLNNNPTVEDVWNSTPAWGFPWISADSSPKAAAVPIIAGGLAQDVAGVGAYALWNNHLYGNLSLYRSEHAGGSQPNAGTGFGNNISGAAPYWRFAWQQSWGLNYLEVGTYGIYVSSTPNAVSGLDDRFFDPALDLQYERPFGNDALTVHSTYIHERSNLHATFDAGGSAFARHHLDTFKLDGTYHIHGRYTTTLGGFKTTGNVDPVFFAANAISGSANGSPDSTGYTAQFAFWPMQNIDISIAYTGYTKFNGGTTNYDGSGRNASDNNTTYLALWLNF
jgi:hypothetical protein